MTVCPECGNDETAEGCDACSECLESIVYFDAPGDEWPGDLLNVNALRGQTRYTGRLAAPWRAYGVGLAHRAGRPPVAVPARIWAEFRFPTNHRRDTPNLYPTAKAIVDGLVDAGLLPDDCDGVVEGPFLRRVYPNGPLHLRLVIEPITPDDLGQPHGGES